MKRPCAYCLFHKHCLTVRQVKEKKCLCDKKGVNTGVPCPHLVKYKDHPWWAYLEEKKKIREMVKERKRLQKNGG